MLAGLRTRDLRKVYNSPPPMAAGGGFSFSAGRGKKNKQSKAEIVALDGLSLDGLARGFTRRNFRSAGTKRRRDRPAAVPPKSGQLDCLTLSAKASAMV